MPSSAAVTVECRQARQFPTVCNIDLIEEAEDDATRDALMIAAAQKCEHYEIASYGTIRVWANLLGKTEVAALFEDTLEEEKETDHKLTQIAESVVDQMAADRGDDEDEEEGEPPRQVRGASRGRAVAADRGLSRC